MLHSCCDILLRTLHEALIADAVGMSDVPVGWIHCDDLLLHVVHRHHVHELIVPAALFVNIWINSVGVTIRLTPNPMTSEGYLRAF